MVGSIKSIYVIVSLFLFCLPFISCDSKDDSGEPVKAVDLEGIIRVLTKDTWRVESYKEANVDETANYADYIFTFNPNGTVGATNGSVSVSGAWILSNPEYNFIKLELFFSGTEVLTALEDSWEISDYSNVLVTLSDNRDDGGIDTLSFRRN